MNTGLVVRCAIIARSIESLLVRSMTFDPLDIGDGIVLTTVQSEDAEEIFALIDSNRDYLREWFPWVDRTNAVEDKTCLYRSPPA